MTDELRFFIPISKIDKERRTVSGYASTETKDLDGEIVSLDAVKKALPGYMAWGNIREMHRLSAVGTAKEAHVDGTGLFLTAKIIDENAWQKCLEGVYKGYSIGGRKVAKVGNKITDLELSEISIVDRPSNPDARFTVQKSARGASEAYLVKATRTPPDESRALRKAVKLIDELTKTPSEPDPNLNDDHAETHGEKKTLCKEHGVASCKICAKAAKKAKKAEKLAKRKLKAEKIAKRESERKAQLAKALPDLESAEPSFLTLNAGSDPEVSLEGKVGFGRGPSLERIDRFVLRKDGGGKIERGENTIDSISQFFEKGSKMDNTENGLSKAILDVIAKAAQPTRAMRFKAAGDNLRKARDARKAASGAVEAAHKTLKAAYISKLAKAGKKPTDDDEDDDPMAKAMSELQKAFGELGKVGTFTKAAREQLKKAAGRSGQRGQEAGDGESGFYEVPAGVKDRSPREMAGAKPGDSGSTGEPPLQSFDSNWAGKLAKFADKDGRVSADVATLLAENASLAARGEALSRLPADRNGRRPFAFDMTKVVGGGGNPNERAQQEVLFKGVDMNALSSEDENVQRDAKAAVAGNYLLSGQFGKSIFDPGFRGGAAGRS